MIEPARRPVETTLIRRLGYRTRNVKKPGRLACLHSSTLLRSLESRRPKKRAIAWVSGPLGKWGGPVLRAHGRGGRASRELRRLDGSQGQRQGTQPGPALPVPPRERPQGHAPRHAQEQPDEDDLPLVGRRLRRAER